MINKLDDLINEARIRGINPTQVRLDYNSYKELINEFNNMMMPYNRIEENRNTVLTYRGIKVELIPEVYDGIKKMILE